MYNKPLMFTVGRLADMTGGNKQYLSKKVKELIYNSEINMQAELKSNREGYRIPESEVIRCFDKITKEQIDEYKRKYYAMDTSPKVRKLNEQKEQSENFFLQKENEILTEWKIRLASATQEEKNSPQMYEYLEQELNKIQLLKEAKLKEYVMLEMFIENCDKMIDSIQNKLKNKN